MGGHGLGGRFTTLEGLLRNVAEKLENNPFLVSECVLGVAMCTLTYEFLLEINPIFAIIRSLFLTGDWERGRRLRHGGDAAAPARVPRQAR